MSRIYLDRIPNTNGNRDLVLYVDPSDNSIIITYDSHIAHSSGIDDIAKIDKHGIDLMYKALLRAPWVKEPESE